MRIIRYIFIFIYVRLSTRYYTKTRDALVPRGALRRIIYRHSPIDVRMRARALPGARAHARVRIPRECTSVSMRARMDTAVNARFTGAQVCVCVCIYIYIHTHTCARAHTYIHIPYVRARTSVNLYLFSRIVSQVFALPAALPSPLSPLSQPALPPRELCHPLYAMTM